MQKILLTLMIIFIVMLGFGVSFAEYGMFYPKINLIMIIIGIFGTSVTGVKFCKRTKSIKKRNTDKEDIKGE
mgnify:CR=1 FL=1